MKLGGLGRCVAVGPCGLGPVRTRVKSLSSRAGTRGTWGRDVREVHVSGVEARDCEPSEAQPPLALTRTRGAGVRWLPPSLRQEEEDGHPRGPSRDSPQAGPPLH